MKTIRIAIQGLPFYFSSHPGLARALGSVRDLGLVRKLSLPAILLGALLGGMLTGCGGANVKGDGAATATPGNPGAAGTAGGIKRGGYYLDDGPGDNPPADIDSIPDAVPRAEALYARASRPYSALGQRYTPMTAYAPYKQRGIASWYGKRYHGQKTSSGEIYDMYAMTGAHTILPLPSYARVTNPENGRSVIVRINDRGPFHSDRLIDLSYAAAYKLRLTGKGSGLVEVESIDAGPNGKYSNYIPLPVIATPPTVAVQASEAPAAEPLPSAGTATDVQPSPDNTTAAIAGNYVQVGAFKSKDNADILSNKLRDKNLVENSPINSWYNNGIYRVRIGPFASRAEAESAASRIKQALSVKTYIIVLP